MSRFFAGRKETKQQVDTSASKKRFGFFRRARSEHPVVLPPPKDATPLTPQRKTQSYRISVYETRSDSPTPTVSSSGSDNQNDQSKLGRRDLRDRLLRRSRSKSPTKHSKNPTKTPGRIRSRSPLKRQRAPNQAPASQQDLATTADPTRPRRNFSYRTESAPLATSASPRRGILKRGMYSMEARKPKMVPIASFDLEIARQSTSLTDAMSSDDENAPYPLEKREESFVIHQPKRTVSFSKDVRDPKPKPTGVASLCLGTRSGRRLPRRRGGFSLVHEFEDLCFDLTYFCRCMGDMIQDDGKKSIASTCLPQEQAPSQSQDDDCNTLDSSTLDRSLEQSVGSI